MQLIREPIGGSLREAGRPSAWGFGGKLPPRLELTQKLEFFENFNFYASTLMQIEVNKSVAISLTLFPPRIKYWLSIKET